jgi:hypothetical protein
MEKTYTCILRNVYWEPRKSIITNGRNLEFIDGISRGVPEYVAKRLLKMKVLKEIIEEVSEGLVETIHLEDIIAAPYVPTPISVIEPPVVEDNVEVQSYEPDDLNVNTVVTGIETVPESVARQEVVPVEGVSETEDGLLTAEEISSLYEKLGTWSAVAAELKITTTVLRKYRDNLGL